MVFSCKLSASHKFFIERQRARERERMFVDMKWLCTVLVLTFHGVPVSIFIFLSLFHCEFYVEFNPSYWANTAKKISKYFKRSIMVASFSLRLARSVFSQLSCFINISIKHIDQLSIDKSLYT